MPMTRVVLASKSASRRAILDGAGVPYEAVSPGMDEDAVKRTHEGDPASLAQRLADEKALAACASLPGEGGALVIGGDQVLEWEGRAWDKPRDLAEARARLLAMAGTPHRLLGGLSLAQGGEIVWRHASVAALFMRPLTEREADAYLEAAGEGVLATVGAYELEGRGARLFESVEGDFFAILGLDLLPLLAELRRRGALAW